MWTFDNVPVARIKAAYGVTLDKAWLGHVQANAVRLNIGCSGAVVSPQGLVFTNQHCVMDCAKTLSSADEDFVADGFTAEAQEDEKTCPGLTAEILTGIKDYTADIAAATKALSGDAYVKAQNARGAEIEKTVCGADKALHCQMISFYQGGEYKLYIYRRYTDVRLVFAPEFQAAFFGGDPDNFNFPRYALDAAFLRLYEDGLPVATPAPLKWNTAAPKDGEAVFTAGNPGWTQRLLTVSQLQSQRDVYLPLSQIMRSELRGRLLAFSDLDADNKRMATDALFDLENAFKAYSGQALALHDPDLMTAKAKEEAYLKSTLKGRFKAEIGDPWSDIAKAQEAYSSLWWPYYFLESAPNTSDLFAMARQLVRAAQEREKPSADRLPEYADARLPGLKRQLLTETPIDKPLDEIYLSFRLSKAREYLTADAAQSQVLLGRESPEALAERLVEDTRLDDVTVRQALWDGGMEAIRASDDPMIQYALQIDDAARAIRKQYDAEVTVPTRIATQKIARVRYKAYGTSTYPDATFSLRLSYGKVAGWTWQGTMTKPFTHLSGLYGRATGQAPYALPDHFADAEDKLDGRTIYNFTTTNDIAGGNSGSPVLNAHAEVIGTVFDGNIHSLGGTYFYDGALNRTVAVSTAAISEALDKVYDDQPLLNELRQSR